MLRGGSDQEMTATSEVMDKARTFSGGWLGTARARGEPEGWSARGALGEGGRDLLTDGAGLGREVSHASSLVTG